MNANHTTLDESQPVRPGFNLFAYQRRAMAALIGWAFGSIMAGGLWWYDRHPVMRGIGTQFVGWGAIDGIIALFGLRGAVQGAQQLASGALNADEHARRAQRFERLLWINTALDALYMLGGGWLVYRHPQRPERRGMGWGVIIQGVFLWFFDSVNALVVRSRR
jgi:hypothetical protein